MKKNGCNNANLQNIKNNYENLHLMKQVNTKHDCQHKQKKQNKCNEVKQINTNQNSCHQEQKKVERNDNEKK
jgi:hypothetical protein